MLVLLCNVGSTSLKYKLYDMPEEKLLVEAKIERVRSIENSIFAYKNYVKNINFQQEKVNVPDYSTGIKLFLKYLTDSETGAISAIDELTAVGFKTVHAKKISGVQVLTDEVIQAMEDYIPIVAPLHNTFYVEAIKTFKSILPHKPMVGVFETAFHQTIPEEARVYGIPYEWTEKYGIKKAGFHGSSHKYISTRVREIMGGHCRLISCHLGGSSSVSAIANGQSVDNSFGFSPQSGLSHANRVGDLDSFVLLYLMKEEGLTVEQMVDVLTSRGGLYGISGVSNDLRDIEEQARQGNERAQLAIDVFCYEVKKYIGSYYAVLGGLDCLVFTGGIGENSSLIREKICSGLEHMGIQLDQERNRQGNTERLISPDHAKVKVYIMPTNEEIGIARDIYALYQDQL